MTFFEVLILAIVEGLTEFLPVSSTGHMIIVSSLLGIEPTDFVKMFTVAIQFGAILSVVVIYREKFFKVSDLYFKLFIAFLPAAVFGFLLNDFIDELLESPLVVGISLLVGGIVLVFVDSWFKEVPEKNNSESSNNNDSLIAPLDNVSYMSSLKIGFFQVIAMIPGVSRSAATIIGGLTQKLNRKQAAEFSFFLAVPTMLAATGYKMLKYYKSTGFKSGDVSLLLVGNVIAFLVAFVAIKSFIGFLNRNGFKLFGWYRIVVGLIIILFILSGKSLNVI